MSDYQLLNMCRILHLTNSASSSLDDLRRVFTERDRIKVEKAIKGLKVRVVHRGENRRKYKIFKLTPTPADKTVFTRTDGPATDVASYFHKQYTRRLAFPFLPCVVVQKDTFLPVEV